MTKHQNITESEVLQIEETRSFKLYGRHMVLMTVTTKTGQSIALMMSMATLMRSVSPPTIAVQTVR